MALRRPQTIVEEWKRWMVVVLLAEVEEVQVEGSSEKKSATAFLLLLNNFAAALRTIEAPSLALQQAADRSDSAALLLAARGDAAVARKRTSIAFTIPRGV